MEVHYLYDDGEWHETALSMMRKSPCDLMAEKIDEALTRVNWSPIAEAIEEMCARESSTKT